MKHRSTHRFALLFAAALATAMLAAPAAQAFTFESQAPGDSGGAKNYTDPMDAISPQGQGDSSRFDGNGATTYRQGGFSVQFNHAGDGRSFDQRYNPDYLFDPLRR
jgi:hypothetical protein